MAEKKPIPVRLSDEILARLDRAAKRAHLDNRTEVIKLCISSFLDYFEKHGKAELPPNWEKMLQCMDGRTHRYAEQDHISLKAAESTETEYSATDNEIEFARIKAKPRPEWTKREESFVVDYLKKK